MHLQSLGSAVAEREAAERAAATFAGNCRSPATRRAYQADWQRFAGWCARVGLPALPATPHTVALHLAAEADRLKCATLQRRLAAIIVHHHDAGLPFAARDPALQEVWRGIRRTLGTARRGKAPILAEELAEIVAVLPDDRRGRRDAALLTLMFAAALRRSEAVALDVGDLEWRADGVLLHLQRSKTDAEGHGALRVLARQDGAACPVAALRRWLIAAHLDSGPLFRPIEADNRVAERRLCDRMVARIVKSAVERHGLAHSLSRAEIRARVAAVSGHSLRAGLCTSAAVTGAPEWEIMRRSGHRTRAAVQGYIRLGQALRDLRPPPSPDRQPGSGIAERLVGDESRLDSSQRR